MHFQFTIRVFSCDWLILIAALFCLPTVFCTIFPKKLSVYLSEIPTLGTVYKVGFRPTFLHNGPHIQKYVNKALPVFTKSNLGNYPLNDYLSQSPTRCYAHLSTVLTDLLETLMTSLLCMHRQNPIYSCKEAFYHATQPQSVHTLAGGVISQLNVNTSLGPHRLHQKSLKNLAML